MNAACLLLWLGCVAPGDVTFERVTLELGGTVLDRRLEDIDGDGRKELLLAILVRGPDGSRQRELRIHRLSQSGVPDPSPEKVVPVMKDVVAYGLADVRSEPGRELLFLTRSGAWSYSTQLDGYRDNIRRLAALELVYDIPDPTRLPWWGYVIEQAGGDLVLLPGARSFTLWGPGGDPGQADGTYAVAVDFALGAGRSVEFNASASSDVHYSSGDMHFSLSIDDDALFLADAPKALGSLLTTDDNYRAPALADVDGDGQVDLLYETHDGVAIHLSRGGRIPAEPTRTEPIPGVLDQKDIQYSLELKDIDGDGDVDVLARKQKKDAGLEPGLVHFMVFVNDGRHLLREKPNQVMRFRGHELKVDIADIDGDGRPDFVLTKYEVPSLVEVVTGFELHRSSFVFLGQDDPPFGSGPVLRDEQVFDIDTLVDALVWRHVSYDMSGDGVVDLVEVDLGGRVCIRRIQPNQSFFGAGDWEMQPVPWKRFDVRGSLLSLDIEDINGDGIGDMLTEAGSTLTLLLSRREP